MTAAAQRRLTCLIALLTGFAVAACSGDDSGGGRDGGADSRLQDAGRDLSPQEADASNIGERCTGVVGCRPASPLCLLYDPSAAEGVCTRACDPDDPATPGFNEDGCPIGFACALATTDGFHCLKTCKPSLTTNTCGADSPLACQPQSTQLLPTSRRTVCWFPACKSGRDCPVLTADACTGDPSCKAKHGADSFCFREESLARCAVPGNCTAGGICGPHGKGKEGARVGDPCVSDLECTGNGLCLRESKRDGLTVWRNGYCSIQNCAFATDLPEFDCAGQTGATCHVGFPSGLCHRVCDPAGPDGCRRDRSSADRGGDYECYNFEGLITQDGSRLTEAPVCQATLSCTGLPLGLTCADLGIAENATAMHCRDRAAGTRKASETDETGVCLDNTSSGDFVDGGAPAADGGVAADGEVAADAG